MSLVYKLARNFTRRNIQVLMLEDFPSVGFEGQIVNVKPGYARQALLPRNLAVYNFPGVRERLFPNIRQADIDSKMRYYRDLTNFQNKVDNIHLEFTKVPSFANPALLKEEISKKDVIREVQNKHSIELKNENVYLDENIQRFGSYTIHVRDFYNAELQRKFEFTLDIQVKQPVIREARDEKDSKDSKDSKKAQQGNDAKGAASKDTKQAKGKDSKAAATTNAKDDKKGAKKAK